MLHPHYTYIGIGIVNIPTTQIFLGCTQKFQFKYTCVHFVNILELHACLLYLLQILTNKTNFCEL